RLDHHLAQRRHRRLQVVSRLRSEVRPGDHRADRFRQLGRRGRRSDLQTGRRACGRRTFGCRTEELDFREVGLGDRTDRSPIMNPELFSTIVGAAIIAWGAFTALRAHRAETRLSLLSGMATAVMFVLFIRLISPFGGWADWFVWV